MNAHPLPRFLVAAVLCCILGACDFPGAPSNDAALRPDALWQAEVESVALVAHADAAAGGRVEDFDALRASRTSIEAALGAATSDPATADVARAWSATRELVDAVLSHRDAVLARVEPEISFSSSAGPIMARLDEVSRMLSERTQAGAAKQVYLLGRVQLLLQRIQQRAQAVRRGGADAMSAADGLARDVAILERTLAGLHEGNAELEIDAIAAPDARAVLGEARQLFGEARATIEPLLSGATELVEARDAADALPAAVAELRSALQRARLRR
jgi:twitching motility protein PilJ